MIITHVTKHIFECSSLHIVEKLKNSQNNNNKKTPKTDFLKT